MSLKHTYRRARSHCVNDFGYILKSVFEQKSTSKKATGLMLLFSGM